MIHYDKCPVCDSSSIEHSITVKDFSVSGKAFPVWICRNCSFRFTQDVPSMSEIGPYYAFEDYISHTETRKGVINQLYHTVRQITLQQKRKQITRLSPKKTGSILDIGCGTGAFLETMKHAGWDTLGLEPDEKARQKAIDRSLSVYPSEHLFNINKTFDVITMWHVLEHVHDLHAYLEKIHSLLEPDGVLLVAVPNYTSRDQLAYQQFWAAYDVPRHLYHFSPSSMQQLMSKYGFQLMKTLPMWFDSFYVSMLSEKYRNGKVNYLSAFLHGIQSNFYAIMDSSKCSSIIYVLKKTLR